MRTIDLARRNGAGLILRNADIWFKVSDWSPSTGQVYGHRLFAGKWYDYGRLPDYGLSIEERPARRFTVIGEDRQRGAIGICEPFRAEVIAFDRDSAWEQCWHDRENNGRDGMLAKMIYESTYRRGRDDYANIRAMADDPDQPAAYVDESEFDDMLGCVPPVYVKGLPGFLVGEALTGNVFAHYFRDANGNCRARYHRKG